MIRVRHLYPTNKSGHRVRIKFHSGFRSSEGLILSYNRQYSDDFSAVKEILKVLNIKILGWSFISDEYIIAVDTFLRDDIKERFKETFKQIWEVK